MRECCEGWLEEAWIDNSIPCYTSCPLVSPIVHCHLEAEVEASLQRICEALSLSSDGPDTAKPVAAAVQPVKLTPMSRGLRFKK